MRISVRPEGVRSALPATDCVVTGVANFRFAPTNEYAVATAMTTLQAALDPAVARCGPRAGGLVPRPVPPQPFARIERIRPDLRAYSNDDVVAQFNQNGFAYFRQISFVLSSLTMVFAFLLVATLLTVSVNQRLGEIAALRALGIGRARIASLLLWESALLVGGGGAAGAAARRHPRGGARSPAPRRCRDCPNGCTFSCSSGARSRSTSRSSR